MKRFLTAILPISLSTLALFVALLGQSFAGLSASGAPSCTVWTPTLKLGANTQTNVVVGGNICVFPGRKLAWVEGDVTMNGAKVGTGALSITGLPFTSLNDSGSGSFFSLALSNPTGTTTSTAFYQGGVQANSSTFVIAKIVDSIGTGTETFLSDADIGATTYIKFSGIYILN